jgi:hypothetical protein
MQPYIGLTDYWCYFARRLQSRAFITQRDAECSFMPFLVCNAHCTPVMCMCCVGCAEPALPFVRAGRVLQVRCGNYPVVERNHTVLRRLQSRAFFPHKEAEFIIMPFLVCNAHCTLVMCLLCAEPALPFVRADFVLQVRCGNYPVVERNHTVLLNWNHQTLPVLKQVRSCVTVMTAI